MKNLKYLFIAALTIFCFNACEDVPEPYDIPSMNAGSENGSSENEEGVIFKQNFANGLGDFKQTTTNSNVNWVNEYSCATITGHEQDGEEHIYYAAESYLVSPAIDLSNYEAAHVTINYILRYADASNIKNYHQILLSTNYSGDATAATWTALDFTPVEGADWTTFAQASIDIPEEYVGKSDIYIAFKYTSTDAKASTWEVKSVSVNAGKASAEEETETNEVLTVAQALAAYSGTAIKATVKGYIVGWVDGKTIAEGAKFNGTSTSQTNVMIADSPDETDLNNCIPVQLPSGEVRTKVNMADHPENYKRLVSLTGSIEKDFGVTGLKSVTKAVFDGEEVEEETPTGNVYINETFATGLGSFKTAEIVSNFAWFFEEYNGKGYAKCSGYANSASQDAESWLISPTMDFSNETAATISFDYVINKGDASLAATNHKLMITDNYTGDFYTTKWTEIDFGATNDGTWTFRSSGNVAIPASMLGKSAVVIAFKYVSTTSASSTWEMNNLLVTGEVGGSISDTTTPDTGGSDDSSDTPATTETMTVSDVIAAYNAGETGAAVVTGYIVGTSKAGASFSPVFGTEDASNTNILLADSPDETDSSKCIPVQLPKGDVRNGLNLVDNPGNYKKKVTLTGEIQAYFKIAGFKNTSAYTIE